MSSPSAPRACSLIVANELSAAITRAGEGVQYSPPVYPHAVSSTLSVACTPDSITQLIVADGPVLPVSVDWQVSSTVTLVATPTGVMTVYDATEVIPNSPTNIDVCALRVINAGSADVLYGSVPEECYECAIRPDMPAPAGNVGAYVPVDCGQGMQVRVSSVTGDLVSTQTVHMVEHGSYSLLVRDLAGAATNGYPAMQLIADVPGVYPYTPLWVTGAVVFGMFVLHRVLGRLVAAICARVHNRKKTDGDKSSEPSAVESALRFWGFDKRIKAARADDGLDDFVVGSGGSSLGASASLLGGGSKGISLEADKSAAASPVATKPRGIGRIRAIDTLRGVSLAFMIFVNYGAGGYWFLDHAKWNGVHLADLLFPTFVWTQGVSMAISMASARKRGACKWDLSKKVIVRAIKLYAIGCFMNGGVDISNWRLLGVLQYFAVSGCFVGLMEIWVPALRVASRASSGSVQWGLSDAADVDEDAADLRAASFFGILYRDVFRYIYHWLILFAIGAVYLCVQFLLPVPGCPTGYLGPGGLANNGAYQGLGCTGGAHRLVDVNFFGEAHMYNNLVGNTITSAATCADTFGCDVYDPEGVLGWISATWMTFLGLQAGRVFVTYGALTRSARNAQEQRSAFLTHISRWLSWGLVFGLVGGGLCGFAKETGIIPMNKNLWSPSFIFVIAGIDFVCLALLYFVVDICRKWPGCFWRWFSWSGAPFMYLGMNSIVIYCGSEILQMYLPFSFYKSGSWSSHAEFMASNVLGVCTWFVVARMLYLRKIFVNL